MEEWSVKEIVGQIAIIGHWALHFRTPGENGRIWDWTLYLGSTRSFATNTHSPDN